jgi:organic hydroperoxide reductase OsmC/OhrA
MADIQHISRKRDKQFLFQVELNWLLHQKGVLSAQDVTEKIHVATPALFGGEGMEWSPEHLFLSAIGSCFMTTYLTFAKKFGFEISNFECSTIGEVDLVEGRYQFTRISIFPKIFISDEALKPKAKLALEKTQKYCLVSNSINAAIIYHSEVLVSAEHKQLKNSCYAIL